MRIGSTTTEAQPAYVEYATTPEYGANKPPDPNFISGVPNIILFAGVGLGALILLKGGR